MFTLIRIDTIKRSFEKNQIFKTPSFICILSWMRFYRSVYLLWRLCLLRWRPYLLLCQKRQERKKKKKPLGPDSKPINTLFNQFVQQNFVYW